MRIFLVRTLITHPYLYSRVGVEVFIGFESQGSAGFRWIDDTTVAPSWAPWINGNAVAGAGECAYMEITGNGDYVFKQLTCQNAVNKQIVCQ